MRQIYGLLVQDIITDVYRKQNKRTYGLVRATNAGGAGLPFVIYNDYYSHRDFITALTNSSFIGVLWTPEVRASESAEEWLRRMQSVCFSPLAMINAWADGTKPWTFPEVEAEVRATSYLRMQLLPYFYTAFARYYFEGLPPIRALHLEWNPAPTATSDWEQAIREGINDQFMIGEHLMMAPLFAGESSRTVVFPEGKWYDFFTGELVGEAEVKEMTILPDQIPLYVRDGGIIPMLPPVRHAPRSGEQHPLTIRHYGQQAGTYTLYDDDGETFDYEQDAYQWRSIEVTRSDDQWTGTITPPETDKPNAYTTVTWRFMTP
jgi:alpha-D-xyloside xylohydrolase